MDNLSSIVAVTRHSGLVPRGAFGLADGELADLADLRTIVLIGMAGRAGWGAFAASAEARDGHEHPLDRFSRRVIDALACDLSAVALYPFGGPPHLPFQQWAQRAEPVHASPIGLLIHAEYGLWHSYRGALGFARAFDVPPLKASPSPCDSCDARWCLCACPVGAFSAQGYDVAACAAYLQSAAGASCMEGGCLARRACPVGAEHGASPEQAAFTMRAFLRARQAA